MVRVIVAALIGGILLFVWGFVSWTVLTWHNTSGGQLPNEEIVVAAMQGNITESGIYWIPGMAREPAASDEAKKAAEEAWMERHRAGPIGMLVYHPEGREPMMPKVFAQGLGLSFLSALIAAVLLVSSGIGNYVGRVAFVTMLGLFVGITADMSEWNWFSFPMDWTLANVGDRLVGWLLVGLVMAAIVKPNARRT